MMFLSFKDITDTLEKFTRFKLLAGRFRAGGMTLMFVVFNLFLLMLFMGNSALVNIGFNVSLLLAFALFIVSFYFAFKSEVIIDSFKKHGDLFDTYRSDWVTYRAETMFDGDVVFQVKNQKEFDVKAVPIRLGA